ncbi:MAG: IclR family transcriptional regulator [Sphingomonas sp.]|nr:MAG: IclR family transcriptional regulator [Sphingomonas sp.]
MAAKAGKDTRLANRRGVQSIDIGMRILEALAASDEALPLKAISESVGMASSNVHRYLASFVRAGLLRQDPDSSRYDLGRLALRIGLAALSRIDILEMAKPELKRLAHDSGLLGIASVFGDQGPTIVRLQQSSPPVILTLALGTVLPLLRSPSGLVFLAYMPEETTREMVERELVQGSRYMLTPSTPRTPEEVARTAANIRKAGFAINDVDVSPGLRAIACPILDLQANVVAVLSLTGPDPTLGPDHPALHDLAAVCRRLSEEAGYRPSR